MAHLSHVLSEGFPNATTLSLEVTAVFSEDSLPLQSPGVFVSRRAQGKQSEDYRGTDQWRGSGSFVGNSVVKIMDSIPVYLYLNDQSLYASMLWLSFLRFF